MLITAMSVDQLLDRLTFSKNITLNIVVVPNFVSLSSLVIMWNINKTSLLVP